LGKEDFQAQGGVLGCSVEEKLQESLVRLKLLAEKKLEESLVELELLLEERMAGSLMRLDLNHAERRNPHSLAHQSFLCN
jgi:hypothetical protein